MGNLIPKHIVVVKSARGQNVRIAPTPMASTIRTIIAGGTAECLFVMKFDGVPYARVLPDGWMRVAESDNSVVYLEVIDIPEEMDPIAKALNRIADVLEKK